MKLIAKLTAVAALAALTNTGAFASPANWPPTPRNDQQSRMLVPPVTRMKCETMVIAGGGSHGRVVVPCKDYATVRPTECHQACANK